MLGELFVFSSIIHTQQYSSERAEILFVENRRLKSFLKVFFVRRSGFLNNDDINIIKAYLSMQISNSKFPWRFHFQPFHFQPFHILTRKNVFYLNFLNKIIILQRKKEKQFNTKYQKVALYSNIIRLLCVKLIPFR